MIYTATTFGRRDTPRKEARRYLVVRMVLFIYLISLVEGPLRKWFLPGLAGPLTLLRDPLVFTLYAYALVSGLMLRQRVAVLWLSFAAVTSCFGLLQYMLNGLGLAGWLLGVRAYWLYMPLAFIVGRSFRLEDVLFFLRLNLWILLPYALLVTAQYSSGFGAWINRGVGGDEPIGVGLGGEILRPFGLFTYTTPNQQFTSAMIAVFASVLFAGRRARPALPIFLAMALAIAVMGVLTGSRAIYFEAAITVGVTVLMVAVARPNATTAIRIASILGVVALSAMLFVKVFPDMLEAMATRFESAHQIEGSTWNRIYYNAFSFLEAFRFAPLLGHGIGAGAPGVSLFLGLPNLIYGEADTTRNVNELGVFLGGMFLILRAGTAAWLLVLAFRLSRRGVSIALPLAVYSSFYIAIQQITTSPLLSFLPWLLFGLVLAIWRAEKVVRPPRSSVGSFKNRLKGHVEEMRA